MVPELIIGKPYIEKNLQKSRLCSHIYYNNKDMILYYEVDDCFERYFDISRADAFVVGLINSCMYDGINIICKHPISSSLYFQLTNYYIPIISKSFSNMHRINITADLTSEVLANEGGVGTGNSGGVDSTYTMLKYRNTGVKGQDLTHVLFTNISTNDIDNERIKTLFNKDLVLKNEAAKSLGYIPINLYTNLFEFYRHPGIYNHYFAQQYCSAAFALGKLFKTYYFSSAWTPNEFSLDEKNVCDSARYDIFSLSLLNVPNLNFYSAGMEVTRSEKIEYINKNGLYYAKKYLQVCSIEQSEGGEYKIDKLNCGHCNKCGRTIIKLYLDDVVYEYDDIIDLSYFKNNKAKFIAKTLAADQKLFTKQFKKQLKQKHKYPFFTPFYYILYKIRFRLAKNKRLVKIYHRFKRK